jgi:hypothetical protein
VEPVEPSHHVGNAEADLPADSNAKGSAAVGAEVVDRQRLHAEIFGKLTYR